MQKDIDVTFDFRRDTPEGKDPDAWSPTLRRYHRLLWSKPLPSGTFFELSDTTPGHYLFHRSEQGTFSLTSDAVIPTFKWAAQVKAMITESELDSFNAISYTIGGMMVFPGNQIDGRWTINQARGCTRVIGDRFDLTVECIRRHYIGVGSPMSQVLARYASFFGLFTEFRGYVEFFLLQDIVTEDCTEVRIAPPFDQFRGSPIPTSVAEYNEYKDASITFITARNQRIQGAVIGGAGRRVESGRSSSGNVR
jgi:hypothetical protein